MLNYIEILKSDIKVIEIIHNIVYNVSQKNIRMDRYRYEQTRRH